jgi:Mce-associated membrane protein
MTKEENSADEVEETAAPADEVHEETKPADEQTADEVDEETVDEDTELVDEDTEPADEDTESPDDDADDPALDEKPSRFARLSGRIPRPTAKVGAIVLAVVFVATAALAGWMYWYQYQPDKQTVLFTRELREYSPAAKAALTAATTGTVSLLSYSPESVDRDLATAKTHLTGEFLDYYSKFTEQIVAPAAKQKGVKTTATVIQAAVSELYQDSAVVLLFVNQTTMSKDRPEPNLTASSVVVRLQKVDNNWLIAKFDPV